MGWPSLSGLIIATVTAIVATAKEIRLRPSAGVRPARQWKEQTLNIALLALAISGGVVGYFGLRNDSAAAEKQQEEAEVGQDLALGDATSECQIMFMFVRKGMTAGWDRGRFYDQCSIDPAKNPDHILSHRWWTRGAMPDYIRQALMPQIVGQAFPNLIFDVAVSTINITEIVVLRDGNVIPEIPPSIFSKFEPDFGQNCFSLTWTVDKPVTIADLHRNLIDLWQHYPDLARIRFAGPTSDPIPRFDSVDARSLLKHGSGLSIYCPLKLVPLPKNHGPGYGPTDGITGYVLQMSGRPEIRAFGASR